MASLDLEDAAVEEGFDESMSTMFARSQAAFTEIENSSLPGHSAELQEQILACIMRLQTLDLKIRREAIFSKNEIVDDVNTSDLKYLLVQFYLGVLHLKLVDNRYNMLRKGSAYLNMFRDAMIGYKMHKAFSWKEFEVPEGADLRTVKIMRFKAERANKERLEVLMRLLSETKESSGEAAIDLEDVQRERWILTIQNAQRKTEDELDMTKQEIDILKHMASLKLAAEGGGEDSDVRMKPKEKEEPVSDGISVTRITPDFMITREKFKDGVFRPGHNLPTMSLEEFAEIEMRNAREREEREREAPGLDKKYKDLEEEGLEDDHELRDKASVRDRKWDDWKDDNPKGAGVTKRW